MDLNHPSLKALAHLADNSQIPFIVARYNRTDWTYWIKVGNVWAREHFRNGQTLSEKEYVAWLYQIRGLEIPIDIFNSLNDHPEW